jgi:hypothetical protein
MTKKTAKESKAQVSPEEVLTEESVDIVSEVTPTEDNIETVESMRTSESSDGSENWFVTQKKDDTGMRVFILVDDANNVNYGFVATSKGGYPEAIDIGKADGNSFFIDDEINPRFKTPEGMPIYQYDPETNEIFVK